MIHVTAPRLTRACSTLCPYLAGPRHRGRHRVCRGSSAMCVTLLAILNMLVILYYSLSFKSFQNAAVTWFANNRLVERWIPGWYRPTISYVVFSKHNHDQPSSFPEDGHEERSAWERAPGEAPAACHTGPGRRGRRRFFEGKSSSKHRNECLGIHHFWGLNIKSWRLTD